MNEPLSILANLLTGENGSILIHVLLFVPLLVTAQYLWLTRHSYSNAEQKRLGIGLSILIGVQLVILIITILFLPVNPQAQLFPAIMERATTIVILIVLFWLWMPKRKQRLGDILFGVLLLFTFVFFIFTLFSQNQNSGLISYNASWFDFGWQVYSTLVSICGILIFSILRPKHWRLIFLICGFHLAAFILHITLTNPIGNYSAIVRLAQIITYPFIPAVFFKLPSQSKDDELLSFSLPLIPAIETVEQHQIEPKIIPVMDYQILTLWTSILTEEKPEKILGAVCRALAHTLKADLCYIISGDPQQKELLLQGGYDLIREVEKTGGSIKKNQLPKISKALENAENLQLTIEEEETGDIRALRSLLSLDSETNLLLLPMGTFSNTNNAVLLLSPYSKRIWSKEEQNKVKPINQHINGLFEHLSKRTQIEFQNEQYAEQITELEIANQDWQRQFDDKHQEYLSENQVSENLRLEIRNYEEKLQNMVEKSQYEKISTLHQQRQGELDHLQNNNEELKLQLEEMKSAFFDVEQKGEHDQIPEFNGSNEVESMLAIQLESQEVISRLHQENTELQSELEQLSSEQSPEIIPTPNILSRFGEKKFEWLQNIQRIKYEQSQQKIKTLSEKLSQMLDQVNTWENITDDSKLRNQIEQWKSQTDSAQEMLSNIAIDETRITFPQLLDEIFENLNEIVMRQDLTLRVDIPDGMNDIPIHDDKISHFLKTLLQDLVQSLQQDNWLSIKIEKQYTNLIIHISLGCSEELQNMILAILNKQDMSDDVLDSHFGLILAKDLVENMQGMIESTQNTLEQTNLHIRLPIS
ncbi:MAG: hypothetical protein JEZ00_11630 [Anaerolineaceae bacterium]|nr:hypothetical protein [Anaerolineaceae bacterium]